MTVQKIILWCIIIVAGLSGASFAGQEGTRSCPVFSECMDNQHRAMIFGGKGKLLAFQCADILLL